MTIPAYDESYLDSMMQKTRYLFRIIARNSQQAFDVITDYMTSDYREYMDMGNPLYHSIRPDDDIRGNCKADRHQKGITAYVSTGRRRRGRAQ